MPTFFTHAVVGLATGKAASFKNPPKQFWILSVICPVIPDADVIGFAFGIRYGDVLGHRGFSHSILFALILALIVVFTCFREEKRFSKRWFFLLVYFFFITASHGLLDALTDGGLGIAFFAPFENSRYFFPSTPISVSPIGIGALFNERGRSMIISAITSELVWIWLPAFGVVILGGIVKRARKLKSG